METNNLSLELRNIENEIFNLKGEKTKEIEMLETERYWPLIEQSKKVRNKINEEVSDKYQQDFTLLYQKKTELTTAIETIKINEAANLWHPAGTIVTLWQSRYGGSPRKSDQTGIVQIYDGTQEIPANIHHYNAPKKGDVVVFHIKKDGTMGMKFDIIAEYGNIKHYYPMWLAEGETPTDNFRTKMIAKQNAEESEYKY